MLIINAELTCGTTIEEGINTCLDFSKAHGCMVRVDMNDVKITFVDGMFKTREEAVKYYRNFYDRERMEK